MRQLMFLKFFLKFYFLKVFKSLAVSKVIHLLLITKLHNNTNDLLYKIQENFIWQRKKAKIKHSTLCNGYQKGGIKC